MKINVLYVVEIVIFSNFFTFVKSYKFFSDDPDIDRNSSQLIDSRGFVPQTHNVITRDGYILTIFRLINPRIDRSLKLYPIYLQYGLSGNSDQLLISRPGTLAQNGSYIEDNGIVNNCSSIDSVAQTLPFVLSSCGYDVWLGNMRGSEYSSHIFLDQFKSAKYWSFTLDHYTTYDITAIIQYILSATQSESIGYIGYSLGNTVMFQLLSTQTQYSRVIKPFISMASFVYLGNIVSPLLRLTKVFEPLLSLISIRIGGLGRLQRLFGRYFCGNALYEEICILIYYLIGGFDFQNFNRSIIPRLWSHFPDGVSSIASAHLGQRIRSKTFSYYNYGFNRNIEIYGQKEAPNYNLTKIDSNFIVLMSGLNDFLSDPTDNAILRSQLKIGLYADYVVRDPHWTHGDFIYSNSAGKYINAPILKILESLSLKFV